MKMLNSFLGVNGGKEAGFGGIFVCLFWRLPDSPHLLLLPKYIQRKAKGKKTNKTKWNKIRENTKFLIGYIKA